jgi:hypothetical protein
MAIMLGKHDMKGKNIVVLFDPIHTLNSYPFLLFMAYIGRVGPFLVLNAMTCSNG